MSLFWPKNYEKSQVLGQFRPFFLNFLIRDFHLSLKSFLRVSQFFSKYEAHFLIKQFLIKKKGLSVCLKGNIGVHNCIVITQPPLLKYKLFQPWSEKRWIYQKSCDLSVVSLTVCKPLFHTRGRCLYSAIAWLLFLGPSKI